MFGTEFLRSSFLNIFHFLNFLFWVAVIDDYKEYDDSSAALFPQNFQRDLEQEFAIGIAENMAQVRHYRLRTIEQVAPSIAAATAKWFTHPYGAHVFVIGLIFVTLHFCPCLS